MKKHRLLSLCAGIGMFDYAAQQTGAITTVAVSEINPFCSRILAERYPDVPNLGDINGIISASDDVLRSHGLFDIDILGGGIPCQPWSGAGKRLGEADDRDLWPQTLTLIRRLHPRWVCIENVARFARVALDRVQADLESAGYDVGTAVFPACAVGAPHIRERCFVLAHTHHRQCGRGQELQTRRNEVSPRNKLWHDPGGCSSDALANAAINGCNTWRTERAQQSGELFAHGRGPSPMADTKTPEREGAGYTRRRRPGSPDRRTPLDDTANERCKWDSSARWQAGIGTQYAGNAGMDDADSPRLAQRQSIQGDPSAQCAPPQRADRQDHRRRLSESRLRRSFDGHTARLDGSSYPAWRGEAQKGWEPPRTVAAKEEWHDERLMAIGNSVEWRQAYMAFAAIVAVEEASA